MFIKNLQVGLSQGINQILNHPFIEALAKGALTKAELIIFAEQYAIYNSYFPRFMGALAGNIVDDATRMPIIENLWEEHGSGDISKSHRKLYERFAKAIGVTDLEYIVPLSSTSICCEHLLDTCLDDDFIISLGAMGPGTEYFTNQEYARIVEGLKQYDWLTDEDLEFWTTHISLDEDHYSDMLKSILPYTNTVSNRYKIKVGARKAIDLEILFWDGIWDEINQQRN